MASVAIQAGRRKTSKRMSLTPLIDVVFILLVFFMLESSFLRSGAINFNPDKQGAASEEQPRVINVEVQANGSLWLNGAKSSLNGLSRYLVQFDDPSQWRAVLAVDKGVSMQRAVHVIDRFNARNFYRVSIVQARRFE